MFLSELCWHADHFRRIFLSVNYILTATISTNQKPKRPHLIKTKCAMCCVRIETRLTTFHESAPLFFVASTFQSAGVWGMILRLRSRRRRRKKIMYANHIGRSSSPWDAFLIQIFLRVRQMVHAAFALNRWTRTRSKTTIDSISFFFALSLSWIQL